jgi:ABC-type long-subunit fatty acid transport system fused permease/ATPase subunit
MVEMVLSEQNKDKQKEFISFLDHFDETNENSSEQKFRQLIKNTYKMRYELMQFNFIRAIYIQARIKILLDEIASEKLNITGTPMKLIALYSALFHYSDNLINPYSAKQGGKQE